MSWQKKVNTQRELTEAMRKQGMKAELESLKQLNISTGKRTSELEKQIENEKREHDAFCLVCKKNGGI